MLITCGLKYGRQSSIQCTAIELTLVAMGDNDSLCTAIELTLCVISTKQTI